MRPSRNRRRRHTPSPAGAPVLNLVQVLFGKYGAHLPLNRRSQIYAKEGIGLDTSTLADWVGACAATLMPLVEAIAKHIFAAERIHADDTTVPVLAKGKTRTGRLWVYVRAIERAPTGPVVLLADVVMAVLGRVFAPTVAALTLGLVAEREFAARLARNAVFDRAGNIFIAALVGLIGWWSSQRTTFYLIPMFALLSAWAVLSIPASAIDHDRARGFTGQQHAGQPESWWRLLFHHRSLLILAAAVAIFHFANASMLPLAGQKLALAHPGFETALLSACILVGQLVTMPVAILVGIKADVWGRKPLLIAACLALVLRGIVFASFDSAPILVTAQILDGISSGILDILIPLMLADIVGGTGRYSTSRGLLGTVQGVGGSLSNVAAGTMVVWGGYGAAFVALTMVAAIAFCLVVFAMPETGQDRQRA